MKYRLGKDKKTRQMKRTPGGPVFLLLRDLDPPLDILGRETTDRSGRLSADLRSSDPLRVSEFNSASLFFRDDDIW